MKNQELNTLIKLSYDIVAKNGSDAARIYHAIVKLDERVRKWKARAYDLGWAPVTDPCSQETCQNEECTENEVKPPADILENT